MEGRVKLTWRPSERGGRLGPPVALEIPASEHRRYDGLYRRIDRMDAGAERSALIAELRTLLDLRALFPGGELICPDAAPEPAPEPEPVQESLLDPGRKDIGRFHAPEHGAPETQRLAAISVYAKSGTQRRQVLDLIAASSDRGRTDEELESILRGRHQAVSARRNELVRDGWIVDSGRRRKTTSGRLAVVWVLTDTARSLTKQRTADTISV